MKRRVTSVLTYALLILSVLVAPALPCQTLPPGQSVSRKLEVTGFTLPPQIVYGHPAALTVVPSFASSQATAKKSLDDIMNAAMQSVIQSEMRQFDPVTVSTVVNQIKLSSTYNAYECTTAALSPAAAPGGSVPPADTCIVTLGTVTGKCTASASSTCASVGPPPSQYTTYEATIKITNAIIAGWTDNKWDQIALSLKREVGLGPLGNHFVPATFKISS
ncbi:hypothetical protein Q1695_011287 [Nippostrongylus brasiliensis]|nr:hypothetical protein Q1695_011287 [Nippostrongylus brasiliensis]